MRIMTRSSVHFNNYQINKKILDIKQDPQKVIWLHIEIKKKEKQQNLSLYFKMHISTKGLRNDK